MPNEDDWFDETEEKKQLRRDAASKFLIATKSDSDLRREVTSDPSKAREAFQRLGEINLPPEVKVICLDPERHERAKLVVFVLLDPNKETPAEPYREHWIAAWQPYK
jgi:hypothetical protein